MTKIAWIGGYLHEEINLEDDISQNNEIEGIFQDKVKWTKSIALCAFLTIPSETSEAVGENVAKSHKLCLLINGQYIYGSLQLIN